MGLIVGLDTGGSSPEEKLLLVQGTLLYSSQKIHVE